VKALVYAGAGRRAWTHVPDPTIAEPMDIVVRVDTTTICASDIHILTARSTTVAEGRILGHEAVGAVVATGTAVRTLAEGDRVLVPAITSCGRCANCRRSIPGHCRAHGGSGWALGNSVDGLQAEYARVPYAETSVHRVPDDVPDVDALFLADVLPTGYELGVRNGRVRPGDSVAVVGLGPVGLSVVMTARLHGAAQVIAVGNSQARLRAAERFGADVTVDSRDEDVATLVAELTGGDGVDVAIEAAGTPSSFQSCVEIVRVGGTVANIGVHAAPVNLALDTLWRRNVTITTGLVDMVTIPELMKLVRNGSLRPGLLGTHSLALGEVEAAYELCAGTKNPEVIKVVLRR
jgi:alcohol dehydrogenase